MFQFLNHSHRRTKIEHCTFFCFFFNNLLFQSSLHKLLGHLMYTTKKPEELILRPLNRHREMTGKELFEKLKNEADNYRKKKTQYIFWYPQIFVSHRRKTRLSMFTQFQRRSNLFSTNNKF